MARQTAGGKRWAERTMTIDGAREALADLPARFAADQALGAVIVADEGRPVLVVLPADRYEGVAAMVETIGEREMLSLLRDVLGEPLRDLRAMAGRKEPLDA